MMFLIELTRNIPETAGVMFFGIALIVATFTVRKLANGVDKRRAKRANVK